MTGSYRRIGREFPIGRTVTENVSAPDPSLPVPEAGATAARPISFTVPPHLGGWTLDMIWPDPTNSSGLQFQLFDPQGALVQESYDDGTPGHAGPIPNIQHVEVSDPQPGRWTAQILWGGLRPGPGPDPTRPAPTPALSFRVSRAGLDRPPRPPGR